MSYPSSPRKHFNAPFAEPTPTPISSKEESSCGFSYGFSCGFPCRTDETKYPCLPESPVHETVHEPVRRMRRKAFLDAENKIRVILQEIDDSESDSGRQFPIKDCPHPNAYMKKRKEFYEYSKPDLRPDQIQNDTCANITTIFLVITVLYMAFCEIVY
jgi:hypothetical protein